MLRLNISSGLLAAGIALTAAPAHAAITYQGSDTEGSVSVSYTIKTDGTLGLLSLANILSSSITFSGSTPSGAFAPFTATNNLFFRNTNAGNVSPVSATATNLFFNFAGGGGLNMSTDNFDGIYTGSNSVNYLGSAAPSGAGGLVFALAGLQTTDYDSVVYHTDGSLPDREIDLIDPNYDLQPGTFTTVAATNQVFATAVAAVVPEPSAWALVILGLSGMTLAARGRRRATVEPAAAAIA